MKTHSLTLALAVGLILVAPLGAQELPGNTRGAPLAARQLVKASELKTYYFTPQNIRSTELRRLAESLYGRRLFIEDRGGLDGEPVQNIQQLGDTLLIYDTAEYAQMLGEALHGMDTALAAESEAARGPDTSITTVATWSPNHIGLGVATAALDSFRREAVVIDERGTISRVPNVSVVRDLGQLILRDTAGQVQAMIDMLEQIDLPEQQLYVTCLVIRGQHEAPTSKTAVPAELQANLSKLVPFEHFELLSMGVLRASALADKLELQMDDTYRIEMRNQGYDAETKSLSALFAFSGPHPQRLETRTTLRTGEYTVLGATGSSPLFAVLKIEPIDE